MNINLKKILICFNFLAISSGLLAQGQADASTINSEAQAPQETQQEASNQKLKEDKKEIETLSQEAIEENLGVNFISQEIENTQGELEEEIGIRFFFDYYATLLSNVSGGYRHSTTYNQEIIYGFEFDLEKMIDLKGLSLRISGGYDSGADLRNAAGTFFSPSQVALVDGVIFYELYLEQDLKIYDMNVKVKAGRLNLGDDFCTLPAYGLLASGAMDANPAAIFANSPFTGSPIATWGLIFDIDTNYQDISFGMGLIQAPKDLLSTSWDGLNFDINDDDGYMAIFEMRWTPSFDKKYDANGKEIKGSALEGVYNVGGYFFGGYNPEVISGYDEDSAYGIYLQGQQMLCRWGEKSYLSAWAGMQYAPEGRVSAVKWMSFCGLQLQGFIPERINDGLLVSYYAAFFSNEYKTDSGQNASSEMGIEITYVFQLNSHIALQPDLQYIIRPNGDSSIDNAFILGGQIAISF